jgi:hypothetical protein
MANIFLAFLVDRTNKNLYVAKGKESYHGI